MQDTPVTSWVKLFLQESSGNVKESWLSELSVSLLRSISTGLSVNIKLYACAVSVGK